MIPQDRAPQAAPPLREWFRQRIGSAGSAVGVEGSFRRNAIVLTAGTMMAQALPLALYPVFARIYEPAEFGVFATLSLFATIASLVATGTYEQAILIAPSRRVAAHLAAYAVVRAAMFLSAILALSIPIGPVLSALGIDPAVIRWMPAVPVAAAGLVIYVTYSEWCVRSRYFGELSKVRIWQTSSIAAARLGMGLLTPGVNGFVAGDVIGKLLSAIRCSTMFWKRDRPYFHISTFARMRSAAERYAHIARYSLPDQLINNLAGSIHVLFLGAAFGTQQLGYVTLVLSVLYLPVTVVSSAVKDVFRQRASVEYATAGSCRLTYRNLLRPIGLLALAGFGILYVISPWLFPFVLGSDWAVAGEYARILTPLFFWNFVSMSLGGVLVIAERTDVSLMWQLVNLLVTVGALIVGTSLMKDMAAALWCFTIARASSYILYMVLSYYHAERPRAAAASA